MMDRRTGRITKEWLRSSSSLRRLGLGTHSRPHNQATNTLRALVLPHRRGLWQQTNWPAAFKRHTLQRKRAHGLAWNQGN